MHGKLKVLALASVMSLGLLAAFSLLNDRGGLLGTRDLLSLGGERVAVGSRATAAQGTGCLPTTGTVSGLTFAQGVNAAIAALISSNSGASAPATDCSAAAVKGQVWLDTSVTPNVERRYDGTNWVAVGAIDSVNHVWVPPVGGGNTAVTAASTTNICAAPSAVQTISGTTTITSFGSDCVVGARKTLIFSAETPITYNAASMILPGQRSYTTAAGDAAEAIHLGAGSWRVLAINRIDGSSVTNPAVPMGTVLMGDFATIPPNTLVGTGQAISRTTYSDYFAAVTRAQTGTLTSGNNTITSVSNTRGFGAGMPIEGTGIPSGTTVASVTSTTIVMSANATASGSQTNRVFLTGYGTGGDSTTVGVKNCVGSVLAGLDPSGARLSSATGINQFQGSKEHTLNAAQLPVITPTTASITQPEFNYGRFNVNSATGSNTGGNAITGWDANVPVAATRTQNVAVTMNSFGSGQAHPNVQPTTTAECVVVVLP